MLITNISINKIVPDENNPRELFEEGAMASLRSSIKSRGIKRPLDLEVRDDGKYLIQDGERRFRAAQELGLKEVPAIIKSSMNETERLIEQIHLQKHHERWTPIEEAKAVSRVADFMNGTIEEAANMLSLPQGQIRNLVAFGKIIDKKSFEKSRLGIRYAETLNGVKATIKKVALKNDIEFGRTEEKQFENAVYARIANGEEVKVQFFTRIKDSITQKPEMLKEFIDDPTMTVGKMYSKAKAQGASALRGIVNGSRFVQTNINVFMKERSVKVSQEQMKVVKNTLTKLEEFVKAFQE